jgi:hypothetical protein
MRSRRMVRGRSLATPLYAIRLTRDGFGVGCADAVGLASSEREVTAIDRINPGCSAKAVTRQAARQRRGSER